jgi:hypothetical protein
VLIRRVADLARPPAGQRRHPHAVVVDQLQGQRIGRPARHQQDVGVLQVGVGHLRPLQPPRHPQPDGQQCLQAGPAVEVIPDEGVERDAVHPLHFDGRKPPAADEYAAFEVVRIECLRACSYFPM